LLGFTETNHCFSQPKGWKLENQISFPEELKLTDHQKVVLVLKQFEKCLALLCPDNLTTVADWCSLYYHLCKKHKINITKFSQRAMHPRTFCDMVYKTKLLFHSLHKLRFALSEGQKRTYSTGMFLIGHIPSPTLTTHFKLDHTEYENTNVKEMNRDSSKVFEEANKILAKFKVEVGPSYTEVVRDGEGLSQRVMETYQQFSRRRALQNNDTQARGLKTILSNMMTTPKFLDACVPYELYTKYQPKPDETTYPPYIKKYRETILNLLLVDKSSADIRGAFSTSKIDFGLLENETIVNNILDPKQPPNCGLTAYEIDWAHVSTNNKLAITVMTMITHCVTNEFEADHLKKVLDAAGKMPSNRTYKAGLEFIEDDWTGQGEDAVRQLCGREFAYSVTCLFHLIRQKANFAF
jgi:hypothetical protein